MSILLDRRHGETALKCFDPATYRRRGLRKGQSRADAIAMFHEANPGVPLPPGWDFPGNVPEKPVLAKMASFRKEPPPPPPPPKGDLLSYVTVEQIVAQGEDSLVEAKQGESSFVRVLSGISRLTVSAIADIVMPSGPSRPVATAMRLDIANADETDFEKLGVEVREPLRDPEAVATPENVGHPVFRHHVVMQGLPILKAVDPTKVSFLNSSAIASSTCSSLPMLNRT